MTVPIRVLLVDDQSNFADLTSSFLETFRDDFAIDTAQSVDAALEILDREPIECIVSDYQMPTMDGLEFLSVIRESYPDLPFIMFTGRGNEKIASEAISAGVTEYVQKRSSVEQYTVLANRIENVTARWRSERALRERERQLSTLFENLPGMVFRSSPERYGTLEFVSQGCRALTGYEADQLTSGSVDYRRDIVHPNDTDRVSESIGQAIEGDETYEVSYRISPKDDTERWVLERGSAVFENGALVSLEGFITDITKRKHREREVREHRRKREELHQAAVAITAVEDEPELYRRTVDAAQRILSFDSCWIATVEDGSFVEREVSIPSLSCFTSVSLEDNSILSKTYREQTSQRVDNLTPSEITGVKGQYHSTITVPFGTEGVFQVISSEPSSFSDDDLELAELLVQYATETLTRLRSQDALRTERDRFAALFSNVRDPIVQFQYDGDDPYLRTGNPAFERVFGYDVDDVRGEPINDLMVPEEKLEEARTLDRKLIQGERIDTEIRRLTTHGLRDFLLRNVPVNPDDNTNGYFIYTDITEQKRREQALQRQREQLLELIQINSLIRDIAQALVDAESREAIEQGVCDRLANTDHYTAAWIGGPQLLDQEIVPRAHANGKTNANEGGSLPTGVETRKQPIEGKGAEETSTEGKGAEEKTTGRMTAVQSPVESTRNVDTVVTAMETNEVQVSTLSRDSSADLTTEPQSGAAKERAVSAIPLTAGKANYGVLTVHANRPDAFDADERAILGELGQTIGHAINAVEQKKLLTADTSVELEFHLHSSDSALAALADRLDCSVTLEGFFTRKDGRIVHYVTVASTSPELVLDVMSGLEEVIDGTLICEYDDEALFEFTATGESCIGVLAEFGAVVQEITVESGRGELVASVAPDSDIRTIVDAFRSNFPSARLHAKREIDRPIQTVQQFRHTLNDRLTDRQRAALQAAYFARYFAWPRASTAEEVAASMGITSATLHYHLRIAQQKLLRAFFDDRE